MLKSATTQQTKQSFCYLFKKNAYISLFSKNNVLHLQKSTDKVKKQYKK